MKLYSIYALFDLRTDHVRYVGYSYSPDDRCDKHLREARKSKERTHKLTWLRYMLRNGFPIGAKILESDIPSLELAMTHERYWVAKLRKEGHDLTNATEGGEGMLWYHHSEETKKKLVKYWADRKRAGIKHPGGSRPGWHHKHDAIEKIRESKKHLSPETRKALSTCRLGKRHTTESKKRMGDKSRGKIR